jgi:hypothetical protein
MPWRNASRVSRSESRRRTGVKPCSVRHGVTRRPAAR